MAELIPRNTKFDFIGTRGIFVALSIILLVLSFVRWFSTGDEKYGTDFLGGSEFVVEFQQDVTSEDIRKALKDGGLEAVTVQSFETGSRQFSLRTTEKVEEGGDSSTKKIVEGSLGELDPEFKIVKSDFVGPTVGAELRQKALFAVLFGLVGMLAYVTFRFEFAFAVGAVAAIFHDIVVALGLYLWADFPITMASLAGALTIAGYSINDTIVVFDRIREEVFKGAEGSLKDIVNRSINASLSRTILTSLLTFFSTLALFLFGGGAISDLSFFLCVGVLIGTYSTIYIASPVMMWWHKMMGGSDTV